MSVLAATPLIDTFGRIHDDLRVSVTDRCNLRCTYCMPLEPEWFPRSEILSFEEIQAIVRVALAHGVRKLRITGGEPLVRRGIEQLVALLADEDGVDDLSLTTNGLLLESRAADLAAAGLRRVNVSLDTLVAERYTKMTRRDVLAQVLRGLDTAVAVGLSPVKVNAVLLRGVNEDEVEPLVERSRRQGWEVRFIEFMPLENGRTWDLSQVVTGEEVRRRIASRWPIEPEPGADPSAPATRYKFADGKGRVGFIDSVTRPFCSSCSRIRLTADGKLRVCLYDDDEADLRRAVRGPESEAEIARLMLAAVRGKGRGGALDILEHRRAPRLSRTMHQIGG